MSVPYTYENDSGIYSLVDIISWSAISAYLPLFDPIQPS